MGSIKSKRHGRIRIESGDTPTALSFTAEFTEGDFSYTVTKNITQILDRGVLRSFRRGDDAALEWSFTAKFQDQKLQAVLDEFAWPGQTETIAGLTSSALNSGVATTIGLGFKQETFFITDPGFTKLATGATPAAPGEYAENTGTVDEEGVTVATTIEVFMPAADTDIEVFYSAIGQSATPASECSDVKTYKLLLDFFDPCNPGNIEETHELGESALTEFTLEEGDEFDTVSFSGISLNLRPVYVPAGPPPP